MVDKVIIKPCVVLLEQCTPKAQIALSAELKNAIQERNILTAKSKRQIFSALDEIDYVNKSARDVRRQEKKNLILQEILDSEVTYLKQLEILSIYFMKPIKETIDKEDFNTIFGNIETIYEVNGALLDELKKDLTNVAKAFLKLAPFFKLYSVYAYDYNKAIKRLQFMILHHSSFAKLVNNQETRPEVQTKLSALLIAPIQRIPRYCLLLQQVLDNSAPTDPDYSTLKITLTKVQQAANHINTLLAEKENTQRLLELQRSLSRMKPAIIQPGRVLIKEGFVKKFSTDSKPDERKYCVLLSDILMLCEIKKANIHAINSLKCELIFPLNKCTLKYYANTKIMEVNCENEQLYIYHESSDESEKWYDKLQETISNYIYNRQTLKKDSSLRRPAKKNNINSYSDVGISPYKHRIKRRQSHDEHQLDNFNTIYKSVSEESPETSCFSLRPSKRKSVHDFAEASPSKIQKLEMKDSLFPLRYHSKRQKSLPPTFGRMNTDESTIEEVVPEVQEDNKKQLQKSWRIVNMFTNVSKGFKRLFGYE